ncbi:zinc ribbon domain-containing protein [Pyrobaculum aerophilum]|uniref:DNA-binding protein n=1 Tax=Pyrobaculum aerophilum TaxID=13773 RepID=A0A371QWN5_9CREN|nr:zinc ribbon domain-containing protein [Pyrobaculum aerophilum]RFA94837.1 hypothetical protein CGL51_09140 [Pyrobaculum aerophilum]RFA99131.1 hypothetical protein CGL52_05325 [Pyrobaculum aerophilum]
MADIKEYFQGWKCPKCGSSSFIIEEHSLTGTGLTRLLDWEAYEYVALICGRCGYTEFYSKKVIGGIKEGTRLLDLLFG